MNCENKPAFYAIIPADVRYDKNLTANAKLLYGEITALCSAKGFCWATNAYFAELYGVSKNSISTWVSQLIERGYLKCEVVYRENSKEVLCRKLHINQLKNTQQHQPPHQENCDTLPKKTVTLPPRNLGYPTQENLEDITTLNNTVITTLSKGTNVPLCPQQKIKDLYSEKLSEWLPSIKIWSDARAKALQARWKFMLTASRSDGTRFATNEEEGLAIFAKFFDFVAASDFLCGRKDGSGFVADIDFLLTQSKFIRVIEGFYNNKNNEVKS